MTTYNTRTTIAADGSTNVFALPFPYLDEGDVNVQIGGVPVTGFTFPTNGSVQLPYSAASLAGQTVLIFRSTSIVELLATFAAGGLDPNDLNDGFLQLLYALQELSDAQGLILGQDTATLADQLPSVLPTSLPPVAGVLWNDGGAVSIS